MFLEFVLLAKIAAVPAASPAPAPPPLIADACASLVPSGLATKLQAEEPGFELPSAQDAGSARLQSIATSGDWPCPFIVLGDFDGNGALDRALLIKNPGTQGVKLVVALNSDGAWQIKLAEDWGLTLAESYLKPMEPGLYQRSDAGAKPAAELDLLNGIQSDSPGFAAGKPEGRYAAYFFLNGRWQHLWMQD